MNWVLDSGKMMIPGLRFALLKPLAVGAIPVVFTIFTHALAVMATLSFVRREKRLGREGKSFWNDFVMVMLTMTFTMAAHLIEIAWWAILFIFCGEFREFGTAYYHSAVNYTTLGYGD
ncbi:MAG: ion channel, partial [Candidatus Acidiferrales bacterium]